jgi:hypothetical protein
MAPACEICVMSFDSLCSSYLRMVLVMSYVFADRFGFGRTVNQENVREIPGWGCSLQLPVDEVARAGSLRQAAERLNVTASALQRRIRDVEEDLGTRLFERLPSGTRLVARPIDDRDQMHGSLVLGQLRGRDLPIAAARFADQLIGRMDVLRKMPMVPGAVA